VALGIPSEADRGADGADGASDLALAERLARHGDAAAFHALYARHTAALYALALRLAGDEADAEDAVHDTWLRAVEGLHRFRGASSLRTWLIGVLINRVRETARARHHASLDDLPEMAAPGCDDALVDPRVDAVDLERALAELPHGYREVLVLHDVDGHTHEAIGRLLGIEVGTSKSQLSRARRRLRAILQRGRTDARA
jgi:RNA polymerase sigma-70 factor (ECF subfamily)